LPSHRAIRGDPGRTRYGTKKFNEQSIVWVDSSFLDVFTFSFIEGNPKTAFTKSNSVVITGGTGA